MSRHDWRCYGCWRFVHEGASLCRDCAYCQLALRHCEGSTKFRCECGWWRKHL
jgi:hypothetical protein